MLSELLRTDRQILKQSQAVLQALSETPIAGDDDDYVERDMEGNPIGARMRKS
jgi:hypothetical protein